MVPTFKGAIVRRLLLHLLADPEVCAGFRDHRQRLAQPSFKPASSTAEGEIPDERLELSDIAEPREFIRADSRWVRA